MPRYSNNNDLTITWLEGDIWVVETSDMTTIYILDGRSYPVEVPVGNQNPMIATRRSAVIVYDTEHIN